MLERPARTSERTRTPAAGISGLDHAVESFWRHHARRRLPLRESVARLAEHALSADPRAAAHGTRVLFERIVEPLCDGFTRRGAQTYRRVFAQVVDLARRRPECAALDGALAESGVDSEKALLRAPAAARPSPNEASCVRAVVVPSRLTLGADIAIAMPVLQRLEALFPQARIAFIGTDSAGVVARSFSRVEHVPVRYGRGDFLAGRLNAWPALREAVRAVCADLEPDEYLLVDPDSRLTQLGLLRPVPDARYLHFPSRSYDVHATDPLGVLVERWMNESLGPPPEERARLRAAEPEAAWARALRGLCAAHRPLVSASFGVGGNARKRAGREFEAALVEWLVRRGCRVALARGVDVREVDETYRLCGRLADRGIAIAHLPAGTSLDGLAGRSAEVVTWQANVDAFVASIECADAYIGYDSAGQHIAAALGVPTLSVFLEAAGRRHALRWTPTGPGPVRIVRSPSPPHPRVLLERTQAAFASLAAEIGRCRRQGPR